MPYTKSNVLRLLIVLGKNGALKKPTIIKTTDLKDILNVSQQTISRWLEELKESNYISKEQTNLGLKIHILDKECDRVYSGDAVYSVSIAVPIGADRSRVFVRKRSCRIPR